MPLPNLSEAFIRQHTSEESFQRGQEYEQEGAVISQASRGGLLHAEVEGSAPAPYRVQVAFDQGRITLAECTCPYDWGGWCKHVVATLLACLHRPQAVEERPPLETLLAALDREQLQALLLGLAEHEPALADVIESQVASPRPGPSEPAAAEAQAPRARQTPVDARAYGREVHDILHSLDRLRPSEAYYHVGGAVHGVRGVLEQAWGFIRAGDGGGALAVLEAITDEYVREWTEVDDSDGEISDFFYDLAAAWAEALLSADLTPPKRKSWAAKLEAWAGEVVDYGVEDAFDAPLAAAQQGWDDPALVLLLRGEVSDPAGWDGGPPYAAGALAAARLNVLERQGRLEEYLRLAAAAGETERYATMLARLGRVAEAVAYGLERLEKVEAALALATTLRERGELEAALRVAEHGLTLEGRKARLATWLCDLASAMGHAERAQQAAAVALQEEPSLAAYQRVQELAGERWAEKREGFLEELRKKATYDRRGQVDIFLHEGLVGDAIAAVEGSYDYSLIALVADAAIGPQPEWVIDTCRRQAERIMDAAKANLYAEAVAWLARVRAASHGLGRSAEWQAYLEQLTARHARKYKLRPMLEALRR